MVVNKFGEMNGWNSIKVNLFGRDVEGITGVKYNDNVVKENVYGAGNMPVGRSRGNYSAEASITIYKEEADALRWASPVRLQEIAPFDIVVQYVSPSGAIQTDVLRNCEFTNDGVEATQADGSLTTEYVLILSHIDYNVA
jgi:hypothetical protein